MHVVTGHLPYGDVPDDVAVSTDEAEWWLAAYRLAEASPDMDTQDVYSQVG
jgi:hypothetical protein